MTGGAADGTSTREGRMRVFVTGGTGLVGTRLVKALRGRGDNPVVLTRRPEAAREKFGDVEVVEGDPMEAGLRCAIVRVGIVLDKEGGALAELITPFKLFVGGPVAGGRQYMSWIHHEDMTGLLLLGLDHAEAKGPINGTAPNPVTNREFG